MPQILVADDDELLLSLLEYKLASNGFEVLCAEDGEQALKLANHERPDLIVLDGMMPGIDGFEALSELKKRPRDIPHPCHHADGPQARRRRLEGAIPRRQDYLVKPFTPEELVVRVQNILAHNAATA